MMLQRKAGTVGAGDVKELRRRALVEQLAALALWQKLKDEDPDNPERIFELSNGFDNLAAAYAQDAVKLRETLTRGLELRERLDKKYPFNLKYGERLAASYRNLAHYEKFVGKPAQAEAFYRKGVELRKRMARKNSHVPDLQSGAATDYMNLGSFLHQLADEKGMPRHRQELLDRARDAYRHALDFHKRLVEDFPEDRSYLVGEGVTLALMGDVYFAEN